MKHTAMDTRTMDPEASREGHTHLLHHNARTVHRSDRLVAPHAYTRQLHAPHSTRPRESSRPTQARHEGHEDQAMCVLETERPSQQKTERVDGQARNPAE